MRKRSRRKRNRRRRKKRRKKRRTKERKRRRVMSMVQCLLISLIRRSRNSSLRKLFSSPMVYSNLSSFV